jgi:selenide,water dikinase
LDSILRKLPKSADANVLVGYESSDDAAVYRLSNDLALVQTVDFLTSVTDDPFMYGQIAAANSLSDVYAMGGEPISALSILAYPSSGDFEVLEQILRGGLATMEEGNCSVVGGHSIADEQIKFGYAVTGLIHPDKIWKNVGAKPGDLLVLTKALGSGVISTALKRDRAQESWVNAATQMMASLNRPAADVLRQLDGLDGTPSAVHAATDVTGFGLIGHAKEMASCSRVSLRIDHQKIEYLPGAVEAAHGMFFSAGLKNNREFAQDHVRFAPSVSEHFRALLFDPQTSGGLLASLAPESANRAVEARTQRGVSARVIGEILPKQPPLIEII